MKFSLVRYFAAVAFLIAAGAGVASLSSVSLSASAQTPEGQALLAETDELPTGRMVDSTQTNARGEEVALKILQDGSGAYYLADNVRNIYLFDLRSNTSRDLREIYRSETGSFSDPYAVSAYEIMIRVYDLYAEGELFGTPLKGITGKDDDVGGNHRAHGEIPLCVLLYYGQGYANASFEYDESSDTAFFNIGNGNLSGPLFHQAAATDILAHEYQHAITVMNTDLVYLNAAGAFGEAISDIAGALAEGHEPDEVEFWQTGEDAAPPGATPMRSAIVPDKNCRLNAKNAYRFCNLDHEHSGCDYGGVHYNCTVFTHMQYNLWRKLPSVFTRRTIGRLWFSTLFSLPPEATFGEIAECFYSAAESLGLGQDALDAVERTLFESGLTAEEGEYHLVMFYDTVPNVETFGQALETVCVKDGEDASLPASPDKVYTERKIYTFLGWSENYANVRRDEIVRAKYSEEDRYYTVRFEDEHGELLKEEKVLFEESATPPEPPVKEGNEIYVYPFTGWSQSFETVREDLTIRPVYEEEKRIYTATFLSDGQKFGVSLYTYGDTVKLPDLSDKTKDAGVRFAGWYLDEDCTQSAGDVEVTGNVVLYAKWESVEEKGSGAAIALAVTLPSVLVAAAAVAAVFAVRRKKGKRR